VAAPAGVPLRDCSWLATGVISVPTSRIDTDGAARSLFGGGGWVAGLRTDDGDEDLDDSSVIALRPREVGLSLSQDAASPFDAVANSGATRPLPPSAGACGGGGAAGFLANIGLECTTCRPAIHFSASFHLNGTCRKNGAAATGDGPSPPCGTRSCRHCRCAPPCRGSRRSATARNRTGPSGILPNETPTKLVETEWRNAVECKIADHCYASEEQNFVEFLRQEAVLGVVFIIDVFQPRRRRTRRLAAGLILLAGAMAMGAQHLHSELGWRHHTQVARRQRQCEIRATARPAAAAPSGSLGRSDASLSPSRVPVPVPGRTEGSVTKRQGSKVRSGSYIQAKAGPVSNESTLL
jgi:hypothetical protein